jgi:PucR family transcriptional regulator, purine catabolism regulatory protein
MVTSARVETDVSQMSTAVPGEDGPDDLQVLIDGTAVSPDDVQHMLVQIVLDGGGLVELADGLASLLGGAVLVTAPDGRVLADAGLPDVLAAMYASSCFEPSGRLRVEIERPGLSRHRGMTGNHAMVPVVSGRVDHGRIVAFSPTGALHDDDLSTLQNAATVAALAMTRQVAVRAVESKYAGDLLRDVLTGRLDADQIRAQSRGLGWDLNRPTVVVVAELDGPPPGPETARGAAPRAGLDRFTAAWQSAVLPRDEHAAVAGFHVEVVAVLGLPPDGDVDRLVHELVAAVGVNGGGRPAFSTGVSRVVPDATGLAAGYDQARIAMRVSRRMQGAGALAHFDRLGVFRLLSLVEGPDKLQAFADETLGELAGDDDPELVDLRHTLEVLLDTNLNVAQTARQLHFHYNTLRYRIAKLERMLGPFSTDPQLRLSLHMALQVAQIRGA